MLKSLELLLLYPLALVVFVLFTSAPLLVAFCVYTLRRDLGRIATALELLVHAAPNPKTLHAPKLPRARAAESGGGPISAFGRL